MAFFCNRLTNKQLFATVNRIPSILNKGQYAAVAPKVIFKPVESDKLESHDERNERLKRPLSPHLTIYEIQLTTTLSITHRTAGIILSGYCAFLGLGALYLDQDVSKYVALVENLHLSPITLFLAKALIASPLGYHFANGIRHLYWDTARGLSLKEVYATGYAMLAAATIISLGLAAL